MAGETIPIAWVATVARNHQQRVAASPLRESLREHPESPINLLDDPVEADELQRAVEEIVHASAAVADSFHKFSEVWRGWRPQIGVWVCAWRAMRRAETNARLQRWRERALAGELP